jgi:hypothetical protein
MLFCPDNECPVNEDWSPVNEDWSPVNKDFPQSSLSGQVLFCTVNGCPDNKCPVNECPDNKDRVYLALPYKSMGKYYKIIVSFLNYILLYVKVGRLNVGLDFKKVKKSPFKNIHTFFLSTMNH